MYNNQKIFARTNNLLLTVIAVLVLTTSSISAQNNLQAQKQYADKLYEEHKYFDAITEYKRLLFFDEQNIYKHEANFKIGVSYKKGAFYKNAIRFLRIAEREALNEHDLYNSKIEQVRVNILRGSFAVGNLILTRLENDQRFQNKQNEIYYWRGWINMLSDKWEEASQSFAAIDSLHPLKILSDSVVERKYSVTFAKVISYILPGSGQFYSGNYLSGVMSLGWNIFAGYLTINSFLEERVFDGIITGNLLWLRFYNGNVQNAEKFAIEKNINIANEALRYLKNNYEGIKP